MRLCTFIIFASVMLASACAFAKGPDDIIGLWNTANRDARVEIYKCGTKYCGKIAWLKEPKYPAGSKEGVPGTPILDHNNPKTVLKKKPLIGQQILVGFVVTGDNLWKNGKIYNSNNGKMYSGKMSLVSYNKLKVRGFIGTSLVGGSTIWTRTKGRTI